MKKIVCIVGARPNFVKMAPIWRALSGHERNLSLVLVHTGQHYEPAMSDLFFRQLGLPCPDVHFNVGSGRHGEQTAKILAAYESWLLKEAVTPAATLVVGDVNSTVACALASVKLGVPVLHVEAGLRSFDRRMPEEVNRVVTDSVSELMLVSEPAGVCNLEREGRPPEGIRLVGNVMIDSLQEHLEAARSMGVRKTYGLDGMPFALWTMHRPSNVDEAGTLRKWAEAIEAAARNLTIVFPVHPRTRAKLLEYGLLQGLLSCTGLVITEPLGYLECLALSSEASVVITDSGGLQEETTALGVPCITLRSNTERPITVSQGTSTLVGQDAEMALTLIGDVMARRYKKGARPELWDGFAATRIADAVERWIN